MTDLERLPPDDFSEGDVYSRLYSLAEEELEKYAREKVAVATERLRDELKHERELREQEIARLRTDLEAEKANLKHNTELQKKEIERLENEVRGERLAQDARQGTRKFVLGLYTVLVVFTMGMYISEGLGLTHLSERLLWGLLAFTIGEAAGLVGIVLKYFFPQSNSNNGAQDKNKSDD